MRNYKWRKGAPPHIGFWKTGFEDCFGLISGKQWRWWNGNDWSFAVNFRIKNEKKINDLCSLKTIFDQKNIRYSDYWPENARVPRINPNK